MAYQKCPICNGTGFSSSLTSSYGTCTTCKGQKIINELTGLPPNLTTSPTINLKSHSTDFRDTNMESQQEYFEK